jgi:hypothetical protein
MPSPNDFTIKSVKHVRDSQGKCNTSFGQGYDLWLAKSDQKKLVFENVKKYLCQ